MTLSVDLFFSFRSPYSYLALPKTSKLVADYDVTVNLRPVYPLAVRVPGFFKNQSAIRPLRRARLQPRRQTPEHPVPLSPPRSDRAGHGDAGGRRASALHSPPDPVRAMAQLEGRSLVFVEALARVLWDGSVNGWNEGDHLAGAAAKAGFNLAAMDAAISADPDRYEKVISGNEAITRRQGIGACRPSYSRRSRFSGRTASTC